MSKVLRIEHRVLPTEGSRVLLPETDPAVTGAAEGRRLVRLGDARATYAPEDPKPRRRLRVVPDDERPANGVVLTGWKGYRHQRALVVDGQSETVSPMNRVLEALEGADCDPQPTNNGGFSACCPAHDDRNPSLSVSAGEDGTVLLYCHAGCPIDEVVAALKLPMSALFAREGHSRSTHKDRPRIEDLGPIVAKYDYYDYGQLRFQVCRYEPASGGKTFRQRRPDGEGGWIWNLQGEERVLYWGNEVRHAVKEGQRIWVVEGEKDVESLRGLGEVATCNPGGAGRWTNKLARSLYGAAEVIVVMDDDPPGLMHALAVIGSLDGNKVDRLSLVRARQGKDISDHLAAGHGLDEVVEVDLCQAQSEAARTRDRGERGVSTPLLPVISAGELDALVRAAPTPRFLIKKVWAEDAYGVIGAQDKAGKTFLILDAAVSVASGTAWLDSYLIERPGPVLAFLGEGGERKMHRRLVAIARSRSLELPRLDIHLCFRVPHLGDHDHLDEVADLLARHRPALVILDPLYLAARGAKGSQLIDMGEHLEEIQLLTQAAGSALMVVHHWNQTGAGTGPERFSGAGLAEWGRVRISMAVKSRTDGAEDEESDVVFSLAISGDETMEREVWFRRRVWTDHPDDLASDMHYEIEPMEAPQAGPTERDDEETLMEKVSDCFAAQGDERMTQDKVTRLLKDVIKVRADQKRTAIEKMVDLGFLGDEGTGNRHKYFFIKPYRRVAARDFAGDDSDVVMGK